MRLILARHGETEWNKQRRVQGLTDLELNDTGRTQAEALGLALAGERVKAIYTSPLKRANDTALAIARYHDTEITALDDLREMDVGEVDGLTYAEMGARHRDFLEKWIVDCTSVRVPGGCTLHELQDQAWSAVQEILRRHPPAAGRDEDGVVIAVTHFFPILSILCRALGLELSQLRRIKLDLASTCCLDFTPERTVLVSLNNTCHLREGSR